MNNLTIWSVDPMQKVFKDDSPPEKPTDKVVMESARGALAVGQAALKSPGSEIIKIKPFRLKEEGSKAEITIIPRFVGFVLINVNTPDTPVRPISMCPLSGEIDREAPCKIPDPLLENDCLKVEPNASQPIWLTVEVPLEQKPGLYKGEFLIDVSGCIKSVPVELKIYSAQVPEKRNLYVVNHLRAEPLADFYNVELWGLEYWEILRNFAEDMARHRQNMINVSVYSLIKTIKTGNDFSFNFDLFDRFIELFIRAGVADKIEGTPLSSSNRKIAYLPRIKIFDNHGKSIHTQPSYNIRSTEAKEYLETFLPVLEKHLDKKGWLGIYQQRIFDEPRDEDAGEFRFLSAMVKEVAPKIKQMEPILSIDLGDALDVWIPVLEHFEGGTGFDRYQNFFKELKKKGKEVWFYSCFSPRGSYPNRFIDFPLVKQRCVHWINFKYDMPGFLHWGYNGSSIIWGRLYWNNANEFCCGIQRECYAPGDAFLVYPGDKKPLSCMRYEIHRKSIEDYELLRALAIKNPELAEEIASSILPSITGYERRIDEFNSAWRKLVKALS